MSTSIEWTDETWNPVVGCERVSPGCDHCYAIGVAHRQMQPAHVGLTVKRPGAPTDWTGVVRCLPERLTQPLRWRAPRRVFVNSMSDLFHPGVPTEFVARVFAAMMVGHRHTFQVLTKRPARMPALLHDPNFGMDPFIDRWPPRDRCREEGVAFFVKQLPGPGGRPIKELDEFPEDLRIREYPR